MDPANPRRVLTEKLPNHLAAAAIEKLPFDGKYYNLTSVVIDNLERLGIDGTSPSAATTR